MRIAFVVNQFPVLSETFILNQITGLIDRGHEVDIFASRPAVGRTVHPEVERYGLREKTHYRPRVVRNRCLRVLKALVLFIVHGWWGPVALLRTLNFVRHGKPAASCALLYAAVPWLGQRPYDIIHCHFGPNGSMTESLREIRAAKGKLVTAFHGYDMTSFVSSGGGGVYTRLLRAGDCFMPISDRWKDRLVEWGCDESRIVVHHMGIDTGRFGFIPRRVEPGGVVRLCSTARLTEKKGIEYSIRSVAKLKVSGKRVEYWVIGEGSLRGPLESLIRELGVGQSVRLLGAKRQDEVVELLKQSHLFLAPSVTAADGDQEGTPVAIMEAMAMGLPVVSTLHSGIPELVQDGRSGFLVPERDVDALADKISYLVEHPEVWPEMGRAGREFVEQHYDINKLNDRLIEVYKGLLSERE